ncbi:hypothetical protein CI610_02107 [invertebrate metagenome]|uniref:Uncharacterized protein n=1 Tax=invertebrate metagenome TaxID=1711999 RepID=A0A2H9T6V5_9ZZZZ
MANLITHYNISSYFFNIRILLALTIIYYFTNHHVFAVEFIIYDAHGTEIDTITTESCDPDIEKYAESDEYYKLGYPIIIEPQLYSTPRKMLFYDMKDEKGKCNIATFVGKLILSGTEAITNAHDTPIQIRLPASPQYKGITLEKGMPIRKNSQINNITLEDHFVRHIQIEINPTTFVDFLFLCDDHIGGKALVGLQLKATEYCYWGCTFGLFQWNSKIISAIFERSEDSVKCVILERQQQTISQETAHQPLKEDYVPSYDLMIPANEPPAIPVVANEWALNEDEAQEQLQIALALSMQEMNLSSIDSGYSSHPPAESSFTIQETNNPLENWFSVLGGKTLTTPTDPNLLSYTCLAQAEESLDSLWVWFFSLPDIHQTTCNFSYDELHDVLVTDHLPEKEIFFMICDHVIKPETNTTCFFIVHPDIQGKWNIISCHLNENRENIRYSSTFESPESMLLHLSVLYQYITQGKTDSQQKYLTIYASHYNGNYLEKVTPDQQESLFTLSQTYDYFFQSHRFPAITDRLFSQFIIDALRGEMLQATHHGYAELPLVFSHFMLTEGAQATPTLVEIQQDMIAEDYLMKESLCAKKDWHFLSDNDFLTQITNELAEHYTTIKNSVEGTLSIILLYSPASGNRNALTLYITPKENAVYISVSLFGTFKISKTSPFPFYLQFLCKYYDIDAYRHRLFIKEKPDKNTVAPLSTKSRDTMGD